MATYSKDNFEHIATAIGKNVADVMRHEKSFEVAADWYRLHSRAPTASGRVAPSALSKKMKQVAKAARKLLGHLEVHDPREVPDGPGAIQALSYKLSGYTLDNIH